ncbi:ATP-binding protein [Microbacterium sp. kSW2-24]|uniref:ATP-binding protein n=1 Tax=Microbacterium galbinum TaxID=2851646 RepID=UPI001FFD8F0A|nr:ATP-binding protein [Microbacterium galbinum]MCK2023576.1 ATP-binding protein [Microbacterium galbinum]
MNQPSPYTPGEVARAVPGRSAQIRWYTERAEDVAMLGRFVPRVRVDHAARGIGKTSLLREGERIFRQKGAATVWATVNQDEPLLPTLVAQLRSLLPLPQQKTAELIDAIDSVTVSLGGGPAKASITMKPDVAAASASGVFTRVLKAVADSVGGVAILIDEIQSADKPSLRALANAWQELQSDPQQPAAGLFMAGLPGSVDHIISAATFAERFDFQPLLGIDTQGSTEALLRPAQDLKVIWAEDALTKAVENSNGYPHKVQLMGEAAWEAASSPSEGARITKEHIEQAIPVVERKMRAIFAARWRSASTKQRELMIAMAELGGDDVRRDELANRLGLSTTAISVPRDRLLQKGLIDAHQHGRLSFTLPGFTEYVLEER